MKQTSTRVILVNITPRSSMKATRAKILKMLKTAQTKKIEQRDSVEWRDPFFDQEPPYYGRGGYDSDYSYGDRYDDRYDDDEPMYGGVSDDWETYYDSVYN